MLARWQLNDNQSIETKWLGGGARGGMTMYQAVCYDADGVKVCVGRKGGGRVWWNLLCWSRGIPWVCM